MKTKQIFFVFLILALFSCKTTQLETIEPQAQYNTPTIETEASTVGLGINIDIKALEKSMNVGLKGLIYEDKDFDDDNMLIKVWNTGKIKFTVKRNMITYQLPLRIWYKTGFKKTVLGVTIEDYYEAKGAMILDMSSSFNLAPNWDLTTQSRVENYRWTEEPIIKAAGLNIPIKSLTDFIVYAFNSNILSSIDKKIYEKIDLQNTMKSKWKEFHKPILVNKDFDIWIKMKPQSLTTTPIYADGRQMKFGIGLNAIIESSIGIQPDSTVTSTALPNFTTVRRIDPRFSIHSKIEVPFTKLTNVANKVIVGQEFKQGKKTVRIDSLLIWGQNENVVIKASVSGSAKGDLYCVGTLNLIDSTQTLQIENFDFEMNTRNALLKSANWLMHKNFLKKIEPMLTIQLGEQVDSLLVMTNDLLKNYEFDKGMYLNGKLKNIQLQNITMTKDGFIIFGKIDGEMRVNIKDLF